MLPIDNNSRVSQARDTFLDANSLNGVKAMGRDNDPQALKEIAKKFEAMFVQQMLKNMRAANEVFSEGNYFNSNETQFHQETLDQQMSLELTSGRGLGLADALYAQMQRAYGTEPTPSSTGNPFELNPATPAYPIKNLSSIVRHQQMLAAVSDTPEDEKSNPFDPRLLAATSKNLNALSPDLSESLKNLYADDKTSESVSIKGGKTRIADSPTEFVTTLRPYAEKAAAELNVNADVLLAQAALETGWGKHVIHAQNGENSFNLFNIKADSRWQGDKVNVSTLEYRQGVAQQERADFRRYKDYAQSISDYVEFLQTNPRYQQALEVGVDSSAYAEELQRAGYATDPAYADKIKSLLASDPIRSSAETLLALTGDTNEG